MGGIISYKINHMLMFFEIKRRRKAENMLITATELKKHLGKYLLLSATEDILITRNGKVVSKLTSPFQDRTEVAKSLFGILPKDMTLEEAREERLNRI